MFDGLGNAFNNIFSKVFGNKTISAKDIEKGIHVIKEALVDADVALPVINYIVDRITKECINDKVLKDFNPTEMIIKSVNDILVEVLTNSDKKTSELYLEKTPSVIMMVGLQGSGKTTSAVKLAKYLKKKKNKKVLVASLDVYRPAAQQQLETVAKRNDIDSLDIVLDEKPLEITTRALKKALAYDVLILDTAGRLHIDDQLIEELKKIKKISQPSEILLVADAMIGQDAFHIANVFKKEINVTGTIITRIDGDSRGGVIISMKYVTECPVRFLGTGENVDDFEYFYPERVVGKILGKGDIVSVIEKAQEQVEEAEAMKIMERVQKGIFNFNDMLRYYNIIGKMGGMKSMLQYLPMMGDIKNRMGAIDENMIKKNKAIIQSMTPKERKFPKLLNILSRKQRIAKGSGTKLFEVAAILRQQEQIQKVFLKFKKIDMNNININEDLIKKFNLEDIMSTLKK